MPAKDEKVYARALLDILFTKNEQSQGLVISINSGRPSLDEEGKHIFCLVGLQLDGFVSFIYSLCTCRMSRKEIFTDWRGKGQSDIFSQPKM